MTHTEGYADVRTLGRMQRMLVTNESSIAAPRPRQATSSGECP